jgi:hypothetical protein
MTTPVVTVLEARPAPVTAAPAIALRLRVGVSGGGAVHALALRCQVQIEARRRRYTPDEKARLYELFGDAAQFDRQLTAVTWAHCALLLPGFTGETTAELLVPCTYDLEVASAKYLHGVRDGEIPIRLLFTGTSFCVRDGGLTIEPVPWDVDAAWRLPAAVWRAAMDQFFPAGGWLRVSTATLDRLQAFRGRQAAVSWDQAIAALLERAGAEQPV